MQLKKEGFKQIAVISLTIIAILCAVMIFSTKDTYAATKKLATPKITSITNWGSEMLDLEFSTVKNASSYELYRATKKNGTYKRIATLPNNYPYYLDKNVKEGKTYYYKVKAIGRGKYKNSNFSAVKSKKFNFVGVIKCNDEITIYAQFPYYLRLSTTPYTDSRSLVATSEDIVTTVEGTGLSCSIESDLHNKYLVLEYNSSIATNKDIVYYVTMKYKKHQNISKKIKVTVKNPKTVVCYDKYPSVPDFEALTGIRPDRTWYNGNQMVYRTDKQGTFASYTMLLEDLGYKCQGISGTSENCTALFVSYSRKSSIRIHTIYEEYLDPIFAIEVLLG